MGMAFWHEADRRRLLTNLGPLVAVPLLLALLDAAARAWRFPGAEYVMLPPFAVIVFLLFSSGSQRFDNLRSIVVLPCVGAATGALCWHVLGAGPLSVAVATLVVLLAQSTLKAYMPPALALAVLALLLHADVIPYVAGVAIGTCVIGLAYLMWRRVLR